MWTQWWEVDTSNDLSRFSVYCCLYRERGLKEFTELSQLDDRYLWGYWLESVAADRPHLSSSTIMAGAYAHEVGDMGFMLFSGLLHDNMQ